MRRIGEILLERGWVEQANLDRALAGQRHAGKRLCSMLIARGELEPDHAARALGEQHGCAAVLQKHLEHREQALIKLLAPGLARSYCALPIGRMRDNALIVCVRAPTSELRAALAKALPAETLVFAVAPAHQLEMLIAQSYDGDEQNEFEVDLTTGPIATIDVDMTTGPIAVIAPGDLNNIGSMTLVELDDSRVAKDPSQSGMMFVPGQTPPRGLASASTPPTNVPAPSRTVTPPRRFEPPVTLADTFSSLARATTRDAATEVAMKYAAGRWQASLLLTVKEGTALGHRGHGPQLSAETVLAVLIPLTSPSIVKAAHDLKKLVTESPPKGAIQDRLERLLGQPRFAAAAPVSIAGRVALVLVAGDPIAGDTDAAPKDLDRLAVALGEAYARILRDVKRSDRG